jgi:hypothetical protein
LKEIKCQFHQRSTRRFYICKMWAHLFCAYILGFYFTGVAYQRKSCV